MKRTLVLLGVLLYAGTFQPGVEGPKRQGDRRQPFKLGAFEREGRESASLTATELSLLSDYR